MAEGRQPEEIVTLIAAIVRDANLSPEQKNTRILQLTASTKVPGSDAVSSGANDANGAARMSPQERLAIVTDQLQETLNMEILEDVLVKQNRTPVVYWGMHVSCVWLIPPC